VVDVAVPLIEARPAAPSCCSPVTARCSGGAAAARSLDELGDFRCWCRARRRANSCCAVSRVGQRRAARHREFLGRRRRQGRRAAAGHHRKAAVLSPDDALTKARIEHLKANGGNAFREYQLPEAALALKQGVGRLIRSETDRGVVVICDPRLVDKPMARVPRQSAAHAGHARGADAEKFLRRIAGLRRAREGSTREPSHDDRRRVA
jgi:hypothetical protein